MEWEKDWLGGHEEPRLLRFVGRLHDESDSLPEFDADLWRGLVETDGRVEEAWGTDTIYTMLRCPVSQTLSQIELRPPVSQILPRICLNPSSMHFEGEKKEEIAIPTATCKDEGHGERVA